MGLSDLTIGGGAGDSTIVPSPPNSGVGAAAVGVADEAEAAADREADGAGLRPVEEGETESGSRMTTNSAPKANGISTKMTFWGTDASCQALRILFCGLAFASAALGEPCSCATRAGLTPGGAKPAGIAGACWLAHGAGAWSCESPGGATGAADSS